MDKNVPEAIKELANSKKISQKKLSDLTGLTESSISRYINGTRTPNASALNKIAKALGTSSDFLLGAAVVGTAAFTTDFLPFGIVSAALSLGTMSKLSKSKKLSESGIFANEKEADNLQTKARKSNIIFTGIIQNALLEKGITFSLLQNTDDSNAPDLAYTINANEINNWWFIFWGIDIQKVAAISKEDQAKLLLSKFVLTKPDNRRKSSIVVSDKELYDAFLKMKGNISYKGNLSVILIDTDKIAIESEEEISFYDDENKQTIKIV